MATSSSTTKTIVIKVEGGQAIASMDNVTLSTKELNSELVKLSKNAGKGKAASGATGGATATVLELGRTISDSNYGIRGMANNLSQLVSCWTKEYMVCNDGSFRFSIGISRCYSFIREI
jgi:hypothetical protein